jgi:hypothetical protein
MESKDPGIDSEEKYPLRRVYEDFKRIHSVYREHILCLRRVYEDFKRTHSVLREHILWPLRRVYEDFTTQIYQASDFSIFFLCVQAKT